jgi:hypothetical protein
MKAIFLTLFTMPLALANPFEPSSIPADANWYLHGNLTALRETKTGKMVVAFIRETQSGALNEIENIFEFNPLTDLTGVTLFGSGKANEGAAIIRGNFSKARFEQVIEHADNHRTSAHGPVTVHQWDDKGKTQYAGFHDEKTIIISPQKDSVLLGLDVLSKDKPGLPADTVLPAKNPSLVAYANVNKIDMPDDEGSRIVRRAKSLTVTLGENQGRLEMAMVAETNDAMTTQRMAKVMEGLISLGQLADENISALDINHTSKVTGKTMTMTMDLSATKALEILSEMQ